MSDWPRPNTKGFRRIPESGIVRSATQAQVADNRHQDKVTAEKPPLTASEAASVSYKNELWRKLRNLSERANGDDVDAFLFELAARDDDCETEDLLKDLHKRTRRSMQELKKGLRTARKKLGANTYITKEARDLIARTLEQMNDLYAVCRIGSGHMVADIPSNRGEQITFIDPATLHALYANKTVRKLVNGQMKEVPITKEWWTHKNRRTYFRAPVFDPSGGRHPNAINLWRGLAVEPEQGDWSLMRRHIFWVICRGNPIWFAYLMCWIADIFTNPEVKPGVAFNLSGAKGTGKTKVAEWLCKIMPANSGSFSKGEQLWGKHNTAIQQCLLAVMEEAFWAGDKAAEGRLKDLITSATQMIEPKFVDPFPVANFTRLWMITNEPWSFPATGDERRFFALEASDEHRRDIPYFKAIDAQMEAGGLAAMLFDLLHIQRPEWIELRLPPDTPWLVRQIAFSLTPELAWLRSVLVDGAITPGDPYQELCAWPTLEEGVEVPEVESAVAQSVAALKQPHSVNGQRSLKTPGYDVRGDGGIDVATDVVKDAFRKFVADLRGRSYTTPERLGEFLTKFGVERTRKRVGSDRIYVYRFPSLETLREAFLVATKINTGDDTLNQRLDLIGTDAIDLSDRQIWIAYGEGAQRLPLTST